MNIFKIGIFELTFVCGNFTLIIILYAWDQKMFLVKIEFF
jgi:hypothetical protein